MLYEQTFADEALSRFVSQTPVNFMWDDHEIADNYDQGKSTMAYHIARKAYDHYVAWRNPSPRKSGELYHVVTMEEAGVSVFMLDTRTYRSAFNMTDGLAEHKTMLGQGQLAELKAWLLEVPRNSFKIIASTVMWNDQTLFADYLDGWALYKRERTEILDFIRQNSIVNVVLISADAHWSGAFYFEEHDIYEFSVSPLAAPALPIPPVKGLPDMSFASSPLFNVTDVEGIVGIISISPEALTLQMMHMVQFNAPNEVYSTTLPRKGPEHVNSIIMV